MGAGIPTPPPAGTPQTGALAPGAVTTAQPQPSSTPTAPTIDARCAGKLNTLLPHAEMTGGVTAGITEAWATGSYVPAEGEEEPAGPLVFTQDDYERITNGRITDDAWHGIGGSLMHQNADGEWVFTSREDLLQALEHFERFSQTTGVTLSYFSQCDHVTIVSSAELTAWLTNLTNDPAQLAALVRNPQIAPTIEAIVERGLSENIEDFDPAHADRYYDALENALQRLSVHPRKSEWWTMVAVGIFNQYHSAAVNPDGPDISFDGLDLRDPQVARRFIDEVLEPFALQSDATIEGSDIDELRIFQEQVGQLNGIVNGESTADRPVRTVGENNVYFDDLDLGFSIEITDANRAELGQFNLDGNTAFDYQDLVFMLENDTAPETIKAALAHVPVELSPTPNGPTAHGPLVPDAAPPPITHVNPEAAIAAVEAEAEDTLVANPGAVADAAAALHPGDLTVPQPAAAVAGPVPVDTTLTPPGSLTPPEFSGISVMDYEFAGPPAMRLGLVDPF